MNPIFLIVIAILMAGCNPSVKEVVVTNTVTNYATLPDKWLADCPLVSPPEQEAYQAATLEERIDMWSNFYVQYVGVQGGCNVVMSNARKYNTLKKNETSTVSCKEGVCK